jgi:hypothetical protein
MGSVSCQPQRGHFSVLFTSISFQVARQERARLADWINIRFQFQPVLRRNGGVRSIPASCGVPEEGLVQSRFWRIKALAILSLPLYPVGGVAAVAAQEPESATLYGQVVENPGARPIANAHLSLTPDGPATTTGANGRFVLRGIRYGRYVIRFEAAGHVTRVDTMMVGAGQPADITVRLATEPLPLEPIEVTVRSPALDRAGFYERRDLGEQGTFFTERDIERYSAMDLSDVMRRAPGAVVISEGPGRTLLRFNRTVGAGNPIPGCEPAVFLDGMLIQDQLVEPRLLDFNRVPPSAVSAMEVYVGSNTPLQYRKTSCGAVVIWTKRGG